jgi:hypothetical protein
VTKPKVTAFWVATILLGSCLLVLRSSQGGPGDFEIAASSALAGPSSQIESYDAFNEPQSVEQNISAGMRYVLTPGHASDGLRHFVGKGPEAYTISGRVQPVIGPLSIDIERSGKLIDPWTVPVDKKGCFVLPFSDYADGAYRLVFRAAGTLREAVEVSYKGKFGLGGVNVELRMGDLNGDNRISETEVKFIEAHIGYPVNTAKRFFGRGDVHLKNGFLAGDADLNRNGIIDKEDFRVAESNLNAVGD